MEILFTGFLHLFCNSLTSLKLRKIPYINNTYNNNSEGDEQDLYSYVGKFKKLENLELKEGIIWYIFGCGLLARYSPATLVKLTVKLELIFTTLRERGIDDDRENVRMPSASELEHSTTSGSYPNLKSLSIEDYSPKNLYKEFLKKKFGKLENLNITRGWH